MNIEVPLEKLTWGELRTFVDLGSAIDADDEVDFDYDVEGSYERTALLLIGVDPKRVTNGS